MNLWTRPIGRIHRSEAGVTLIELIVSLTILATITGATTATFLTANNANANVSERLHESNDAQITSGFWTADAQAAGGVEPALGATDATLGVFTAGDGGCNLGGGSLVIGFKWREWASRNATTAADAYTTRVAAYVYRAGTNELERRTCSDTATPGTLAVTGTVSLASRVASVPTISCNPAGNCPGLPATVSITVTETNNPATAPSPYTFTLTAAVRPTGQSAPGAANAAGTPLLALGSSTCSGSGATGLDVSGNTTVVVNGQGAVNAKDIGACTAINANGSIQYASDGTSLVNGGTCSGTKCGLMGITTDATNIGDPFASLPAPGTCTGSGNPPAGQPGTYRDPVTLSGALAPGIYIFCNTVSFSGSVTGTGVMLYFAGTSALSLAGNVDINLTAPTSGLYEGILVWNATTNPISINGNGTLANYNGVLYSPNADVIVAGTSTTYIGMIVAKRIIFTGNHTTDITNGQVTPGAPGTLTATTSTTTTRAVDLAWSAPGYTGAIGNPVLGYEYRVNTGSGYGAWTTVPGGLVTTFTHSCGTSNTSPTSCTYQVRALNALGAGSTSNAATANSMFDATAPAITTPAAGSVVGTTSTFFGTKWNGPGDATTVSVSVYAGATCTGLPEATFASTASGGLTWSATSPALTNGAKCAQVTQVDFTATARTGAAVNFTVGKVKRVALANANGLVAKGDTVTIEFAQAMTASTICSTWSGAGDQSINGNNQVTVTITNGAGVTNDVLTVTSSACTLNVGTIDLGSPNWVTANTTFSGSGGNKSTINYAGSANLLTPNTLTITLGGVATGAGNVVAVPASTIVYTPAAALRDALNATLPGTYTFTGQRF